MARGKLQRDRDFSDNGVDKHERRNNEDTTDDVRQY